MPEKYARSLERDMIRRGSSRCRRRRGLSHVCCYSQIRRHSDVSTRASPQHADCHHVEKALANRTALATALFTLLRDVSSRLVCNAASFSGETRLDLGIHAHVYPFRNSAFSLAYSRSSETRWPCDSFSYWRRRRRVLVEKEGSSGVWFRRPARNGSLRSANVTAQSCIFSRVMTKLIINQLAYCPLWFSRCIQDCEAYQKGCYTSTSITGTSASGRHRVSYPTDERPIS
jgi:hypothetical protein